MKNEEKLLSNHSQSLNAYRVEYRERLGPDIKGPWKRIGTRRDVENGVPYLPFNEGVLLATYTLSFAQAKALMWTFKADVLAKHSEKKIDVRMLRYRVEFNYTVKEHESHEVEMVEYDFMNLAD